MKKSEIRWATIEHLVRKSVLGGPLRQDEQDYVHRAHAADPVKYGRIAGAARRAAQREYRDALRGK